ncbi:MAG: DUF4179 domain-containing protein [Lachnospiraceae bacterium]|nr:DUF4179 domain-containing protein [Lachnospiraceae bacterium]
MRNNNTIENLQREIVIPEIVQQKANLAFAQIKNEYAHTYRKPVKRIKRKAVWASISAAALMLGAMSVYATTYFHWGGGIEEHLHAAESQKQFLEEKQIASPVYSSVTDNGITVTMLQTITDNRFTYLSFKVEGYEPEEGIQPAFEYKTIEIDGDHSFSIFMSEFSDGLRLDENRNFTYLDGSPAKENLDGSIISKYIAEDGSMEYMMLLMSVNDSESLIGKPVHLEFHNLGSVKHAEFSPELEGSWVFDFTLGGSDEVRSCELSEILGNSGSTVIEAEISPISLHVAYHMPLQEVPIDGVDENGNAIQSSTFKEAPKLTGVRLKDGTMLTEITGGGGSEGYSDGNNDIYHADYATNCIIDPTQVDALLFIKSIPDGDTPLTEENLYIVPLP